MLNSTPSLTIRAAAERERRRRRRDRLAALAAQPLAAFVGQTKIEVPTSPASAALVPFDLWPAQREALDVMQRDRLVVYLKSRQVGVSWLTCAFVLAQCLFQPGQPWLFFSQGQLEANELIRRVGVLYHNHAHVSDFPRLTRDNTQDLAWDNGSRVLSLPATKRGGRSFTAAGVVLDEWAFMTWGAAILAAVKPTIDAGGKLFIISSADGSGSAYHQFWQEAERTGAYTPVFIPWQARPDRDAGWRDRLLAESQTDPASVLREYPANPLEAFTHATGLIYDVWSDGPESGNVTEAADYEPDAGPVFWAVDDGYTGKLDPATATYTADSHPRVFLLVQERANGTLNVFAESYAVGLVEETHIADVLALPYPAPDYAAVDKSAAQLKGRLHAAGIYTQNGPPSVEESIKTTRAALAPDANGRRRVRVHPRCRLLRGEMASYRRDANGAPVKQHDHGPDALRYLIWSKRML